MKKLYLGLLSVLFGTVFWVGFVKWDIIDPGIRTPEGYGFWDPVEITKESEDLDKVYNEPRGLLQNPVIYFFSQDAWFYVAHCLVWIVAFLICVFLLIIISIFPLYNIFEKLWEKWRKALIPIKNLYCLENLVNTKKLGIIWWGLSILWRFLVSCFTYAFPPCMLDWNVYGGSDDAICWLSNLWGIVSYLPAIIIFLVYDYLALTSFYRLFRKFGWNKCYSVLWTIFFPIWACILWFGNFKCQWENLEKKEWNN